VVNFNSDRFSVQSERSSFGLGIFGVTVAAVAAGIPFLSQNLPALLSGLEGQISVAATIFFLCLIVAVLALQRFTNQHVADSWFVGLGAIGLGLFAVGTILSLLAQPLFFGQWSRLSEASLLASARLYLSTYLLLAAFNGRHLVADRRFRHWVYGGLLAALLFWLASAFLTLVLLPAAELRYAWPISTSLIVEGVSALLAIVALVAFTRHLLRGGSGAFAGFALAAAAVLAGSLTRSLALTPSSAIPWEGIAFLSASAFLLIALATEQAHFIKIETGLRRQVSQTNEALAKSERAYRTLVENLGEGVATLDREGRIVYCNPQLARMLQTTPESLRGRFFSDWVSKEQLPILRSEFHRLANSESRHFEVDLVTQQNKTVAVIVNAAPVVAQDGHAIRSRAGARFLGAQVLISDLTQRRHAEQRLSELMDKKAKHLSIFEQCIENVTEGIFVLDRDHRITYVNRAFEEMTGHLRAEVESREVGEVLEIPDGRKEGDLWRRVESGRSWRGEVVNCRKDGAEFVADVSLVPLREGEGAPSGYLGVLRDITQQKRLERTLTESAERLRRKSEEIEAAKNYYEALIAGMTDILMVVDAEGRCTFVNEYGCKRLGYSVEEIARTKLPPFFTDLKRLEKEYGGSMKVELKDYEYPLTTRDGEVIHCSWYARPLFDLRGRRIGAMAVGRDITDFKRLQDQLKEHARNLEEKVQERTAELKRRVEQLAKILEIGEEIRLNVKLETILSRICEAIQSLGWRRVLIALRDPDSGSSRIVADAGLASEELERVRSWGEIPFEYTSRYFQERFRISNSYFVDQKHEVIRKDDPYTVYTDLGQRQSDEWQSLDALIVPIRSRGTVLGVITVDDPEDRKKPNLEKVRDLEIFADKAALAIENAEFLRQRRENEERARLLADITRLFHAGAETPALLRTVVEKSLEALGDLCAILQLDEEGRTLRPAAVVHRDPRLAAMVEKLFAEHPERVGEGLAGKVVATAEPLFLQRVNREVLQAQMIAGHERLIEELDLRSLMVVPLRLGSVALGAMYHARSMENRGFTLRDLRFAQDLADRLSLALENARLFAETEEKARELENASRLKSEFLASVSHELRTPLHAILTLSDILLREKSGPLAAEQRRQVDIIQRSGRNLLSMINDILDLSKIEAGRIQIVPGPVELSSLIQQTVEPFRALCDEKGLHLEITLDRKLPERVVTDAEKLAQALRNLLSNAVKFTRRGRITVHAAPGKGETVTIAVRDTGIGIPADRLETIFEEFQQLDSSDSREFGGTGLGLTIARRLVAMLGGEINVESKFGRGSCFKVIVPQRLAELPVEERTVEAGGVEAQPSDFDSSRKSRPLLLVVDDDADAQYAMQFLLEEEGFEVAYATSGSEALTLARKIRPDAILLDMMMPGMDGYKTTEALKNDPATRAIPVIATTAKAMRGDREKVLQAGCDDYLAKPFEAAELLSCVNRWVAQPLETHVPQGAEGAQA
jgi:PAS domain S-box-containing protein